LDLVLDLDAFANLNSSLVIAERELRAAARRTRTYYARLLAGAVGILLLGWGVLMSGLGSRANGPEYFEVLSWVAFFYCLYSGAILTADCISEEKRDGTLGLLFLSTLKGPAIVLGKLASLGINCTFGLLGLFPVLAVPLIMGGVGWPEFCRVIVGLLNTLFISLSLGLCVSTLSRNAMKATATVLFLISFIGWGLPIAGEILRDYRHSAAVVRAVEISSPFFTHTEAAKPFAFFRVSYFGWSLLASHAWGLLFLAISCRALPRIWQDRIAAGRSLKWRERFLKLQFGSGAVRARFRTRLLEANPFYWLAARDRMGTAASLLFLLLVVGAGAWLGLVVGHSWGGRFKPYEGFVFVWLWLTAGLHLMVLYRIASVSADRFGADRASGALELILSTPLSVNRILLGNWRGLIRRAIGPALTVMLIHGLFLWGVLLLFSLHEEFPMTWTTWINGLRALWEGKFDESALPGIVTVCIGGVGFLLASSWIALGWVGMWMGLSMKRPRFAPWAALFLVLIPPWPIFIAVAILVAHVDFLWREGVVVLGMVCTAVGLCLTNFSALSIWAWWRLRGRFRLVATSRFEFARQSWLRPLLFRMAATALLLALVIAAFYRIELWRGERTWRAVEKEIRANEKQLERLDPAPIPDHENFGASEFWKPAFDVVDPVSNGRVIWRQQKKLDELNAITITPRLPAGRNANVPSADWLAGLGTDLKAWQELYRDSLDFPKTADPRSPAEDVLFALTKFDGLLAPMREAAKRPHSRFSVRKSDAWQPHHVILHRIGEWLGLRTAALVELDRMDEAMAEVELLFYLADSVGTEPYTVSSDTRRALLRHALQPIWEGLCLRRWNASQLVRLESRLGTIQLLPDHPRVTLAETLRQIELWRVVMTSGALLPSIPMPINPRSQAILQRFYPQGWALHRQARIYQIWKDRINPMIDAEQQRFYPARHAALERTFSRGGLYLNRWSANGLEYLGSAIAHSHMSIQLARVAIAVERYRNANQRLPRTLDELAPDFLERLPHDIINGEPLVFRQRSPDDYVVYSVGPNEMDNGGQHHADWVFRSKPVSRPQPAKPSPR
jgi:ABC-type transport system involved in multi-copper enzyme maturation permease subunit